MLKGSVNKHDKGMAPLATNECGFPLDFSPSDFDSDGGNMVLWDDVKGGKYPWDPRYYNASNITANDGFDPTFIMRHATDSSATATAIATGQKVSSLKQVSGAQERQHARFQSSSFSTSCFQTSNRMVAVDLYENDITTIVEDALACGMAAGVVTSVPVLHATPASFVSHANDRQNHGELKSSFRKVNPTLLSGVCKANLYPDLDELRKDQSWTILEQHPNVKAEVCT
jgi:alkaline phosphatase